MTLAYSRAVRSSRFSPPAAQALEIGVVGWMNP
jgi:hypothetical protein